MATSVEYLRSILRYDPETGEFWWLARTANCVQIGQKAGSQRWNGYVCISVKGQKVAAHRIAWALMTGSWPEQFIDHADCDPSNNRWRNLRQATPTQNNANALRTKSLAKGVTRLSSGRYQAQIKSHGVNYYLGCYDRLDDAKAAYAKKAHELFGEFARVSP